MGGGVERVSEGGQHVRLRFLPPGALAREPARSIIGVGGGRRSRASAAARGPRRVVRPAGQPSRWRAGAGRRRFLSVLVVEERTTWAGRGRSMPRAFGRPRKMARMTRGPDEDWSESGRMGPHRRAFQNYTLDPSSFPRAGKSGAGSERGCRRTQPHRFGTEDLAVEGRISSPIAYAGK